MSALSTQQDNEYYHSKHLPESVRPEFALKALDSQLEQWLEERIDIKQEIHQLAEASEKNSRALHFFQTSTSDLSISSLVGQTVKSMLSGTSVAVRALDAQMWLRLLQTGKLLSAMTSKKRKEWDDLIKSGSVPPFTRDHVIPTVQTLLSEQGLYFAERVDTIFHALSPVHITNSPAGFGKRLILSDLLSRDRGSFESYSVNTENTGPLDDLRVVVATLMGRATLDTQRALTSTIIRKMTQRKVFGEWVSIDGNSLRIKLFKVGTVHVELHPDITYKLNDILSMIYPTSIPESFRRSNAQPKSMPAFDAPIENQVVSLSAIAVLLDYRRIEMSHNMDFVDLREEFKGHDVLYVFNADDSSDPQGVHDVLLAIGGNHLDGRYWSFDYNPALAIQRICENGTLPNEKNFQYYPSLGSVGEQAAELLRGSIETAGASLLEPSVGQGRLALQVPEASWTCIEVSPTNASVSEAKGLNVILSDFLMWSKNQSERFDGVLMNPPFRNQQALHHVNVAYSLLKPGGVLVAIVPDGSQYLKLKEQHPCMESSEPIENAFDGAAVTVRIIKLVRK